MAAGLCSLSDRDIQRERVLYLLVSCQRKDFSNVEESLSACHEGVVEGTVNFRHGPQGTLVSDLLYNTNVLVKQSVY